MHPYCSGRQAEQHGWCRSRCSRFRTLFGYILYTIPYLWYGPFCLNKGGKVYTAGPSTAVIPVAPAAIWCCSTWYKVLYNSYQNMIPTNLFPPLASIANMLLYKVLMRTLAMDGDDATEKQHQEHHGGVLLHIWGGGGVVCVWSGDWTWHWRNRNMRYGPKKLFVIGYYL